MRQDGHIGNPIGYLRPCRAMLVCSQPSAGQGVAIVLRKHHIDRAALLSAVVWAALTVSAVPAQATSARVAGLAGGEFIEDDRNVQRWYGSLGDYANLIFLEGGHFTLPEGWHDSNGRRVSGPGLGAHVELGESARWGTAAFFLNGQGDDVDPGSLARDRMGTTWSAMWTRSFGSLQPTLMYRRGSSTGEATVEAAVPAGLVRSWDRARTEYGLGVRWDLSESAYLDLAGELRQHREQTTVADPFITVPGPELTSSSSFGLRARSFVRLNPTMALVPLVEYLHEDRPLSAPSPIVAQGLDGRLVKVGAGLNWYPDPDHFLVLSWDYIHADADYLETPLAGDPSVRSTQRWNSLSLTMGFETRFQYWLTFRGSFRYEPVALKGPDAAESDDFATFMVNLGAAIQLGNYDLDLALTDQEPRSVAGYHGHTLFGNPATWLTVSLRRSF